MVTKNDVEDAKADILVLADALGIPEETLWNLMDAWIMTNPISINEYIYEEDDLDLTVPQCEQLLVLICNYEGLMNDYHKELLNDR